MATRSFIHVQREDGNWARIYCHNDGYYENNGRLLHQFYNSQERAEALVALGDLSSLGESIGVKHRFDFYQDLSKKHGGNYSEMKADPEYQRLSSMCNFYGRDRGEENVEAQIGESLEDVFEKDEFTYVWRDGEWLAMSYTDDLSNLRPLKELLVENNIPTEADSVEVAAALALEIPGTLDSSDQPEETAEADTPKPVWAM